MLIPNTFGLKTSTDHLSTFHSIPELRTLLAHIPHTRLEVIGEASNILFTRPSYPNTFFLKSAITGYEFSENDNYIDVTVGSGTHWDDFVAETVRRNLWGAENLSYIPGTVGASAVQNIGAYGAEAKDIILSVEAIEIATGNKRLFSNTDCQYAYRSSIFKHTLSRQYIITSVTYRLSRTPRPNLSYRPLADAFSNTPSPSLDEIRDKVIEIRRSKLPEPSEIGSAGSFFMNPVITPDHFRTLQSQYPDIPSYDVVDGETIYKKVPAAWLIDHAGLKGHTLGGASVHTTQPLVLINPTFSATPSDILSLSSHIIDTVNNKYNILLHPEVIFL